MRRSIDWDEPYIKTDVILGITASELDDFYAAAEEPDRLNFFFVLLNTLNRCINDKEKAAHVLYLIAYYLFVPLTPPASQELAEHYINRAIERNPKDEYLLLREIIRNGN